MCAGSRLQANPMKPVHAGEYIKLLAKQSLKALFTFVTGIDFDASIFDHPQLIFELLSVSRITIHQLFESTYFSRVAFQTLTDLVFETLDFNILIEVGKQVLDFHYFALFGQLYHLSFLSLPKSFWRFLSKVFSSSPHTKVYQHTPWPNPICYVRELKPQLLHRDTSFHRR